MPLGSNLSSYGVTLAEREIARIKRDRNGSRLVRGSPRRSVEEDLATLEIAKEVMSRLNDSPTLPSKVSEPVLWHTNLHMGNIYVSDDDPTKIVSIIDWQAIVIAPLYLQTRWPISLPVEEDYELGLDTPKLPDDYDKMNAEDREEAESKHQEVMLAKAYELSTGGKNNRAWKGLQMPRFLHEPFVRCGEASEEGTIPLRECLIEVWKNWEELRFIGECPFTFTEEELENHAREFAAYEDFHRIRSCRENF